MDMTNKNSITTENTTSKKTKTAKIRVREMTFIALMGALSTILLMFRFPLPFMPPFLSFDLAGVIEIIGGFMFGPLAAFLIILLKILLQLVIQGSHSIGTGELQNLILSCSYVMPALFIYKCYHWNVSWNYLCIRCSHFFKPLFNHSILHSTLRNDRRRYCSNVQRGKSGNERHLVNGSAWNFSI